MFKGPQFMVYMNAVNGVAVQSGRGYFVRGLVILVSLAALILALTGGATAPFGIGAAYFIWRAISGNWDVVLKTTGGDILAHRFSFWSHDKTDAEKLSAEIEDALKYYKGRP